MIPVCPKCKEKRGVAKVKTSYLEKWDEDGREYCIPLDNDMMEVTYHCPKCGTELDMSGDA